MQSVSFGDLFYSEILYTHYRSETICKKKLDIDNNSIYYKWKNHFYEMKGDVGMSVHEKGNKKMPTPRHKLIHNPIPTSLF